jgi:3-oxoacyl-ACP reductase-like protein
MRASIFNMNEALSEDEKVVGGITITKVIKDHQTIVAREGEETTIGELVDRQLSQLAINGETIQDIQLEVNPEYWTEQLARFYAERVAPNFDIKKSRK